MKFKITKINRLDKINLRELNKAEKIKKEIFFNNKYNLFNDGLILL